MLRQVRQGNCAACSTFYKNLCAQKPFYLMCVKLGNLLFFLPKMAFVCYFLFFC